MRVGGRFAYLIRPKGRVDPSKRWVWIFPFEHALASAGGDIEHQYYVDAALAKGFHVAGIDVGVACGSPQAAELCQQFYTLLVGTCGLNARTRILAQSNGGLNAYAWAMRHADRVDRIGGIYPATDLRSWPGLAKAVVYPTRGLGFDLTQEQLAGRLAEFNPIENLQALAKARVKVLHLHGDRDKLVLLERQLIRTGTAVSCTRRGGRGRRGARLCSWRSSLYRIKGAPRISACRLTVTRQIGKLPQSTADWTVSFAQSTGRHKFCGRWLEFRKSTE